MDKNIYGSPLTKKRIETVFDACKYRGCTNRRIGRGGVHLYRFPSRGDARLLTWIKHTGNKLILNWSLSTLRKAGICGDHFSEDSFHNSDKTKLKSNAVPLAYKGPKLFSADIIWDHTYSKEIIEKEIDAENVADNNLDPGSEPRQYKCYGRVKPEPQESMELLDGKPPWRLNPTFIKTYSRKLSFKDHDDSMTWTTIEPGSAKKNVGELKPSEPLKQEVAVIPPAAPDVLVVEPENKEVTELRAINMELRRQNKMLRIENFKLQLRLATQSKGER